MSIKAGEGELRDVAILTVRSARLHAAVDRAAARRRHEAPAGLPGTGLPLDRQQRRQHRQVSGRRHSCLVRRVVAASTTAAADALRAADAVLDAADRWAAERRAAGLSPLSVGLAVASGRVVFGAVGDGERLEFTVIGDAVNFAAKLEKHNKDEKTRALADARTYAAGRAAGLCRTVARASGGRPAGGWRQRTGRYRGLGKVMRGKVMAGGGRVALPFPQSRPM